MTSTSPMMDSVQVHPPAAGMPMAASPSWKPTMMVETSHLNGSMIASKKSTEIPIHQLLPSYCGWRPLSRSPHASGATNLTVATLDAVTLAIH
ncbi:hypothetical protein D9M72_532330 [compost metagenome]